MSELDEGVLKVFAELGENERHFNGLQHQYRTMASGWILAVFAGVQYVLSSWEELPVSGGAAMALIGLAGAVGITLLWNLDLRVYHQLLEAYFVEGLRLERAHPWLPRIRSRMLATQEPAPGGRAAKGVLGRVVWFYVAGNTAALGVGAAGLLLHLAAEGAGRGALAGAAGAAAAVIALCG
ncbi:MAG TPA: hypothetical protein VHG91_12020, partial [Longimicrobium sp.]|nr:hypothetical protein [Longimicrobium sp.]